MRKILLASVAALFMVSSVQAAVVTPDQLASKIEIWATGQAIPDLQNAIVLGNAAKENVMTPCWIAMLSFASQVQQAAKTTQAANLKVNAATNIEKLVIFRDALRPGTGSISNACGPAAALLRQDVASLATGIVTGAAGLAKFAPLIP